MTPKDLPALTKLIAALASNWGREADEATYEAYRLGLDDISIKDIAQAVAKAIRTCKFMPPAAELRDLAGVQGELRLEDRAILAWDVFQKAVAAHGAYKTVDFDDPAINATVRSLGGWVACCDKTPEKFDKWLRKDFERVYRSYCRVGVGEEAGAPLVGIHGRSNAFLGAPVPEGMEVNCGILPVPIETGLPLLPGPKRKALPADGAGSGMLTLKKA